MFNSDLCFYIYIFNIFISISHPQHTSFNSVLARAAGEVGKNVRMEAKAVETAKKLKFGSVEIATALVQTFWTQEEEQKLLQSQM